MIIYICVCLQKTCQTLKHTRLLKKVSLLVYIIIQVAIYMNSKQSQLPWRGIQNSIKPFHPSIKFIILGRRKG